MKWTVAGVGALLSVAGAYAMVNGGSIIQMERGWATFIAGAILLGAGAIVLALAAVIGRIDRLAVPAPATLSLPDALRAPVADEPAPESPAAPEPVFSPRQPPLRQPPERPAPPPPREVMVEPLPTLESVMAQREAAVAPPPFAPVQISEPVREPEPVPASEPEPAARPEALRNFEFVFPPAEMTAEAPVASPERPRPPSRISLNWLRRGKPAPEPVTEEPAEEPAEPRIEAPAEAVEDIRAEAVEASAPAVESDTVIQPFEETPAETLPGEPQAPTPDPFSHDWLERALAGVDEPRESRSRFTPPSVRRAAALEQKQKDETAESAPESADAAEAPQETIAAAEEPARIEAPDDAPESALETEAEAAADAPPAGPAPVEIGRYKANDVAYVMFADGSITAETPAGMSYRFNSLTELRAFIERGEL